MRGAGGTQRSLSNRLSTIYVVGFGFCCAVAAFIAASANAQQRSKVPRVGYLSVNSPASESVRTEAFRGRLQDLGHTEGKNIFIEWRFAEQNLDRLPALAMDLVNLGVDVIVTGGPGATRSANEANE